MRTLALLSPLALLALLALPCSAAGQEPDAPEGAVIASVDVSGIDRDRLSPGLRQDIDALTGTPLDRAKVGALASRIEGEQPEMVAAYRALSRPTGDARVVFMVARISDDSSLVENINARYIVDRVEISGVPEAELSQALRDELQALVGRRLDNDEAEALQDKLRAELPGHVVRRRISRGGESGRIRVVFEAIRIERPWIRFAPSRSKFVYQEDQGWSGALDIPLGGPYNRFTIGGVFGNDDDLIEEYRGIRLRLETRRLGTERVGVGFELSRFSQSWDEPTLAALASDPLGRQTYRTRLTIEPTVTVALSRDIRVFTGASLSELDLESPGTGSQMANAWLFGIGADRVWERPGEIRHGVQATYQLRTATSGLGSDLDYERHHAQAGYGFRQGHSAVIVGTSVGYISGTAPLFERFTLGNSSTLRGWNKHDVAPTGGDRMFHQSIEYRYRWLATFINMGSVWDSPGDRRVRSSAGFGLHVDDATLGLFRPPSFFLTAGFPLNADGAGATFLMGVRF
jgi:predicted outer membrane protein